MAWIEEEKNTVSWTEEIADWFSNGWFNGWFNNKSTPSYTEETKGTVSWIES